MSNEKKSLKSKISDSLIIVVVVIVGACLLFGAVYVFRLGLNDTAPITVHEVEDGIHCAISSGGEAIDCWKVDKS